MGQFMISKWPKQKDGRTVVVLNEVLFGDVLFNLIRAFPSFWPLICLKINLSNTSQDIQRSRHLRVAGLDIIFSKIPQEPDYRKFLNSQCI